MTVNTPKDPIDGVTEWTNEETGIKYQYIGGAWRAVSSKAAQDVADALAQLDLEKVLTNGNIADKDIYLTHIASSDADIIDVSPEKAKVVIATEGSKVPTFELQHYAVDDNSQVKLELDEDGTRFDIECDEKVDNIHFRFEDDVKFELNKQGDAVFSGDVDIEGHLDVKRGINTAGNAYIKLSPKDNDNQLFTIDSGSSYLPMLHLKSYTSSTTATDGEEAPEVDTAARKDVLIVRANGEAELSGHLSVMPGERDNQAVTYIQLLELEQEIEALVPSVERGQFEITLDPIDTDVSSDGKFNLLRDYTQDDKDAATAVCFQAYSDCIFNDPEGTRPCQAELEACSNAIPAVGSKVTTDDFGLTRQIKFSNKDIEGNNHGWSTVEVGQLIEVFNQEDDSYLIAEITATEGTGNELVTISVTPIKYKGSATGVCRIKIFELDLNAGSDLDFVRKTGDTLTGKLILKQPSSSVDMLSLRTKNDADFFNLGSDNDTLAKIALADNKEFKIGTGARQIFKIYSNSTCALGGLKDVNENTGLDAAVNKKYIDSRRLWRWTGDQTTSPPAGSFSFASSGAGSLYFHPIPEVGTRLKCSGNKYLCKGGDGLDGDTEFGYVPFTIWAWESDHWEPAMSGHITYSGMRTGKNDEPWRFTSNKNTIIVLEGLTKDKLYNITVAGTILS